VPAIKILKKGEKEKTQMILQRRPFLEKKIITARVSRVVHACICAGKEGEKSLAGEGHRGANRQTRLRGRTKLKRSFAEKEWGEGGNRKQK